MWFVLHYAGIKTHAYLKVLMYRTYYYTSKVSFLLARTGANQDIRAAGVAASVLLFIARPRQLSLTEYRAAPAIITDTLHASRVVCSRGWAGAAAPYWLYVPTFARYAIATTDRHHNHPWYCSTVVLWWATKKLFTSHWIFYLASNGIWVNNLSLLY